MRLLSSNQLHSIPKKSSAPFIEGIAGIFKGRSQGILGYQWLARSSKKESVKHYTKNPLEALSLDIMNFEHFHITKLGNPQEQFRLPNGELVVPCEFEYQYSKDAIIKKSIEKWHYNLGDGDRAAKAYIESKSGTRRSIALITLPIAEDADIRFYSRSLGEAAEHIMPKLRHEVHVLWVEKIARDTESTAGLVNSLFSRIMNL